MASFPYMSNPARAKEFIEAIPGMGVPTKVTIQFLESVGFKSKNDRAILPVLKVLGFVDNAGVPTETWRNYRNRSQSGGVMAAALRSAYRGLFTTYPDAHRKDNEAIRNYFSSHTAVGEGALKFMVGTFKSLVELADFGAEAPARPPKVLEEPEAAWEHDEEPPTDGQRKVKLSRAAGNGVTININIQLQIPDTDKAETYDNFFAALKKHLLD
jgi:hypothetical protein